MPTKRKSTKKKTTRKTTKRAAPKRKTTRKKGTSQKRDLRQTGTSNREYDVRHTAKLPGLRRSRTGKKYYERRANRSDKSRVRRL